MKMSMDYGNTNEAGDFSPAPSGIYKLKIMTLEDGETRNGDPKVSVVLKVSAGQYVGKKVYHNVTFMAPDHPGAGFAKHWLRVIGQPYEGKVTVDTSRWGGAEFLARLAVEEYTNKNGDKREKNVIEESWNLKDEDAPETGELPPVQKAQANGKKWPQNDPAPKEEQEEAPF